MSIEPNKTDFETALSEMRETIETLDSCVDDGLMDTLKKVAEEYDLHYKSDIQSLIDENEALKAELEEGNE